MADSRFVNNSLPTLQQPNRNLLVDYKDLPVLALEKAVETILPLLSDVMEYVAAAKNKCNRQSTLLTRDESAAIYLYTMAVSFVLRLNGALRDPNRQIRKPWLPFLKLFMTALEKLPSIETVIWRGVNYDATSKFVDDDVYTWWDITSWSTNINSVQSFLGESGTLFAVEAIHGKDITMFSAIEDEHEVILMPGTRVRTKNQSLNFIERLFVIHLEEINPQNESQSESNSLFEQIKQEYKQNSRIERFMNPSMSYCIEQSYINLSIVDTKQQREKEKQLRDAQDSVAIMSTFEQIYGTKTSIDVKNIFNTCKNDKKQILVFGRAGIGKSTFCRYIAYQWATGSYWSHYELLALIPLRHLTHHRYPLLPPGQSYSLIDLVKKETFSDDLSEMEEQRLKKQFDPKKTLWILDGYDEIVQSVPPHLQCLFEKLLKTPHHIITSRPYLNTLSYDVQMEITGFTDGNIKNYVNNFFDQMKGELDDASLKSGKLLSFLQSNLSIWGVAHIPVNLELICSLWSNEYCLETEQITITKLYSLMIQWLCRRYLRTQDNQIPQLSQDEIDQCCQKELAFLEGLAFDAMESNTILIRPTQLKKAWNEANISSQQHPYILNIGILKSFHGQGTGNRIQMNKDHHFVHLSFQEFFAARYLINALRGPRTEKAIEFLEYQKYNQRYTLVFTFAAGLLSETDEKVCQNPFWNTILGLPLDLVGIRHLQLVISCMGETNCRQTLPQRSKLLEWIAQCLTYSFTTESTIIRRHLTQSLQRTQSVACDQTIITNLIDLLEANDTNRKADVLLCISELQISNPSVALITSLTISLDDKNEAVRRYACLALEKIGEEAATNEVITQLVTVLGDQSEDVRRSACKALRAMGEKAATNEVITQLVSALGDQSEDVRFHACEALGKMGEKAATNEVITQLVSALGDQNEYVRDIACEALGKMGEKAATNEVITQLVTALGDQNGHVRVYACKALEKMGQKAATNEVITQLVSALGDQDEYFRGSACEALRYHACKAFEKMSQTAATNEVITQLVSALGDQSKHVRVHACEALGKMGEKAATNEVMTKLVSALGDQNEYVRGSACEALGKMGEKAATNEVMTKLVSALGDQSEYVGDSACEALGKMGEKAATNEVITQLVSALGDQSEYVRRSACEALGGMGEKAATNEVITQLVSALGDQSEVVRVYACGALGEMGEKAATNEVITQLVTALGDQNESVRDSACKALRAMGEKAATNEVITQLVSALGDQSKHVRGHACEALGKMGEKAATNEVITQLVSALGDQNEYVRDIACEALGKMGEKAATNEVITQLVTALGDQNGHVGRSACEALEKMGEKAATNEVITQLVSALGDQSEYVRRSACEALGKMGEKAATNEVITQLVSALGDQSEYVRRSACEALEKMGEKAATNEVITQLVSALGDQSEYVRRSACEALGEMGEKAAINEVITQLVTALGDQNGHVGRSACEALGKMGEKAATNEVITHLVSALGDQNEHVRQYACEALRAMGERAAANEVISKLAALGNSGSGLVSHGAVDAVASILSSSAVIIQLDPKILADLCLSRNAFNYFKNISEDDLVKTFSQMGKSGWPPAVARLTLLKGCAVVAGNDKLVIYGMKEPLEVLIPNSHLHQEWMKAFIDQRKELHLYFEVPLQD